MTAWMTAVGDLMRIHADRRVTNDWVERFEGESGHVSISPLLHFCRGVTRPEVRPTASRMELTLEC